MNDLSTISSYLLTNNGKMMGVVMGTEIHASWPDCAVKPLHKGLEDPVEENVLIRLLPHSHKRLHASAGAASGMRLEGQNLVMLYSAISAR